MIIILYKLNLVGRLG